MQRICLQELQLTGAELCHLTVVCGPSFGLSKQVIFVLFVVQEVSRMMGAAVSRLLGWKADLKNPLLEVTPSFLTHYLRFQRAVGSAFPSSCQTTCHRGLWFLSAGQSPPERRLLSAWNSTDQVSSAFQTLGSNI